MSQEAFNGTSILNETELINGTIPSWRTDYEGDWWTILIVSSVITLHSIIWLIQTIGGVGTIKDLLCDLACQTACDGWRNVDYVTEAAKFFSYWTFMPWVIVTYTGLSVIDGILGICAITLEDSGTMKAAMIFAIGYLILAIVLLIFFSLLSCCYSFCRCCVETVAKEVEEALEEQEEIRLEDGVLKVPPKPKTDEEPVEHSYCWNFFSHFAIPIFVYIILYCMLLGRGWKFAFSEM